MIVWSGIKSWVDIIEKKVVNTNKEIGICFL
jgi:hypothetical protein